MGIYSHLSDEQLTTTRERLSQSLVDRLTAPTAAGSSSGRNVQYQQRTAEIERQITLINEEISGRTGGAARGPIYLV